MSTNVTMVGRKLWYPFSGAVDVRPDIGAASMQVYSTNLAQVVDIVVSHQGVDIKTQLIGQLMSALVLPAPEHYRPLLRRLAALSKCCACF